MPCEAGGEIEYIRNDAVLQEIFPQVTEENPPENVYSPIKAKGLEFPLVILYKFGDELAKEYDERTVWNFDDRRHDDSVSLEYFFNKLYVAASRAMSDLFIIDSEAGERLLWQFASDGSAELKRLQLSEKDHNFWKDAIKSLSNGESLEALGTKDNRESQALRLKKQGERDENSEFIRAAKQYYIALGDSKEADLCEALALKFEKNFSEAGQLFLNRGKEEDAWECFWKGACWQPLKQWHDKHSSKKPVECRVVEFMVQNPKTLDVIHDFTQFLEEQFENNRLKNNRLRKPWQESVKEYVRQIEGLTNEESLDAEQWRRFGNMLKDLAEAGYSGVLDLAGGCFYRAKDYQSAVRCWERCQATGKCEYNLAKAEVEGFPEGLQYLEKAEEYQRIIKEWDKKGKPPNQQWLKYVKPALERQNLYKELVDYLISKRLWLQAIDAIGQCPSEATSLRFDVAREIAYSDLAEDTARSDRSRYLNFIAQVLSAPKWQKYISVQEVGTALEKIGEYVRILKFYEDFVDGSNFEVRQFARERWLAIKKKQEVYEQSTDGGKLDKIQRDIESNARKWNIDIKSVSSEPQLKRVDPTPHSEAPTLPLKTTPGQPQQAVEEGSEWKSVARGIEQRQIGRLQVMRIKAMKQLTITDDTSNMLQVTLDSGRCTIKGKVEDVEVSGSNKLSFKVPESGYTCEAFYDSEQPRIELDIQGLSSKIFLKL